MASKANNFYILFSSIFTGLLSGLSVSPIVSQIIATTLGILITVTSVLSGIEGLKFQEGKLGKINGLPLLMLTAGLCAGIFAGMALRVNNTLGSNYDNEISYWASKTGLSEEQIANTIFAQQFGESTGEAQSMVKRGVLQSADAKECELFCAYEGENLVKEVRSSNNEFVRRLSTYVTADQLEAAVKDLCACD